MTREFDFLPNLPKSNLDDRTFAELVNECLLRIPRYCPEWTNYNPSDPGVTLIELFAWLTDQMLMRFNQVPRRNYIAFLELLGIRLQPPTPAQTDITFYLTASLPDPYTIPKDSEVATLRTEDEEAIIFSTMQPLVIAKPRISHLLAAARTDDRPESFRDLLQDVWTEDNVEQWTGQEISLFNDPPEFNNCFYIVFTEDRPVDGNVIAINFKGASATTTGINPNSPPRFWEAWNGYAWQSVLLKENDDRTKGFSFSALENEGINPAQGAEVILHLPLNWNVAQFANYRGRWLRCSYVEPMGNQAGYSRPPQIIGMGVRSIGGTVTANQCFSMANEILGESNGTSGQLFQLQHRPVLPRNADEYVLVIPPVGLPQIWHEVNDFSESTDNDLHYVLDSTSGTIQFGPFVRSSNYQSQHIVERMRLQGEPMQRAIANGIGTNGVFTNQGTSLINIGNSNSSNVSNVPNGSNNEEATGIQYGAVPPRGAVIQMVKYRTGGGFRGNVQRGSIQIAKSAIPYVANLINHTSAYNGTDAESLDDVVMRVPKILKTRDRAVNQTDFEYLTLIAGEGNVSRVLCSSAKRKEDAGIVKLMIVPKVRTDGIDQGQGIHPDELMITPQLSNKVLSYLEERKMLGVQIQLAPPQYVGVSVQTEVNLEPSYNNPQVQQEIVQQIKVLLYRFLNPITGGASGQGWEFGRPVYPSDIVKLLQSVQGIRFLGTVQLFELRYENNQWVRRLAPQPVIDPGASGLICSWRSPRLRSSHVINIVN